MFLCISLELLKKSFDTRISWYKKTSSQKGRGHKLRGTTLIRGKKPRTRLPVTWAGRDGLLFSAFLLESDLLPTRRRACTEPPSLLTRGDRNTPLCHCILRINLISISTKTPFVKNDQLPKGRFSRFSPHNRGYSHKSGA